MTELKEDPDFWLIADTVLENSQNINTKFFALMVLEETIKVLFKLSL